MNKKTIFSMEVIISLVMITAFYSFLNRPFNSILAISLFAISLLSLFFINKTKININLQLFLSSGITPIIYNIVSGNLQVYPTAFKDSIILGVGIVGIYNIIKSVRRN